MDIELEETPSFGRYFIPSDEATDDVAELTFTNRDRHTMVADHTYVPVRYRGQGVGQALVARLVEDARDRGAKVIPVCPFVRAVAAKHPEWLDVVQNVGSSANP